MAVCQSCGTTVDCLHSEPLALLQHIVDLINKLESASHDFEPDYNECTFRNLGYIFWNPDLKAYVAQRL